MSSRIRILLACAALALTAGLTAFSTAWIGDRGASPGNSAGTGTLELAGSPASFVPDATAMRPGEVRRGTAEIRNAGTVGGELLVRLRPPAPADSPLLPHLRLDVLECPSAAAAQDPASTADCTPVTSSTLAAASRVDLGRTAPGQTRFFRTQLHWPVDAQASDLYGERLELELRWSLRTRSAA